MVKTKSKIFIASDHAGFYVKEKTKSFIAKKGYEIQDLAKTFRDGDDYSDYALKVAEQVAKNKNSIGILVCGTGAGMCIAANKVKGIRAIQAYDEYSAEMSKKHNDANVLCLRGREFDIQKANKIVDIFLKTEFISEERHDRRIRKIIEYENRK